MQQVATQLGMFSPIALQFGAYSAYTQAVSTVLSTPLFECPSSLVSHSSPSTKAQVGRE